MRVPVQTSDAQTSDTTNLGQYKHRTHKSQTVQTSDAQKSGSTNIGRTKVGQYKHRTHKSRTSTNFGPVQTSDWYKLYLFFFFMYSFLQKITVMWMLSQETDNLVSEVDRKQPKIKSSILAWKGLGLTMDCLHGWRRFSCVCLAWISYKFSLKA